MINRTLASGIRDRLKNSSTVALIGPRQVGKTTLAFAISEEIPTIYLDLENSTDLLKVQDIQDFHQENRDRLIILDEVHRLPEIFTPIRGIVDSERRRGNRTGHFLFLGSASIDLMKQSSESLAGRISYLELFPINLLEFMPSGSKSDLLNQLWLRGGFPESLLSNNDENSLQWRRDFIKTYLERDIPQLGPRVPAVALERLWIMLAHSQGSALNASKLAQSLEVSNVTIGRYIDLLVDLLLVRKLTSYTANTKKRLVKSPRVYVRDCGITHALLNIGHFNDLISHPVVGKSWEGFAIENIMSVLPQGIECYYYRTSGGAEIDLLIGFGNMAKNFWAVEIKRSASSNPGKGFYEACEDINPAKKFVVHAGPDSFPIKNNVRSIGLWEFLKLLKKEV